MKARNFLLALIYLPLCCFFTVNTPDDIARTQLGNKHVKRAAVEQWKHQYGYDKPLFYNVGEQGWKAVTDTF